MPETKTQQPSREFGNPYIAANGYVNLSSLQTSVDTNDYNYIKMLRPTQSTMTALVGTFFQRFVAECRARGLVDFTQQSEFESFVANLKITTEDEYNQLKLDSTNWQQLIAKRPELAGESGGAGGLSHRTPGGTDRGSSNEGSSQNDGTGAKAPRAVNPPNAAVSSNVQRKRGGSGEK